MAIEKDVMETIYMVGVIFVWSLSTCLAIRGAELTTGEDLDYEVAVCLSVASFLPALLWPLIAVSAAGVSLLRLSERLRRGSGR